MARYETVGGVSLRCGYTTGACAAAATAGAFSALFGSDAREVPIELPGGEKVAFECSTSVLKTSARAVVIKDGGDDYDVTDGMEVVAEVKMTDAPGIEILGGDGVGTVTKPGLSVTVGSPAINPVPCQMIENSAREVLEHYDYDLERSGVQITISIPGGGERAKRTFNPKLGIEGGLSVLGTTGIVRPMSVEAIVETRKLELSQARIGGTDIAFVFGNTGERLALELGAKSERIVTVSNYIGALLEEALVLGFKRILIIGDLGKLVKVAGGIFRTHSKESDARLEIIAAHAAALGADRETVTEILDCPTTVAAVEALSRSGLTGVYQVLVEKILEHVRERVRNEIEIEVILYSGTEKLAESEGAREHLRRLGCEN